MHDLERHLRIKLQLAKSPSEVDPTAWLNAFTAHQNNHKVFATVVKLALTPISVFSKDMFADPKQKKIDRFVCHSFLGGSLPSSWSSLGTR
jgi:hypothetical protein